MFALSGFLGIIRHEVNDLKNDLFGGNESDKEMTAEATAKAKSEEKKKWSWSWYKLHPRDFPSCQVHNPFREDAQKLYEEERRKKREKQEYQREKFRDGIRQKYGIEKKSPTEKTDKTAIEVRLIVVRFNVVDWFLVTD